MRIHSNFDALQAHDTATRRRVNFLHREVLLVAIAFTQRGTTSSNCTTTRPHYDDAAVLAVQNEIAAFLVAAGHLSYYICASWEDTFSSPATSTWPPLYDLPLGAPLADGVLRNGIPEVEAATTRSGDRRLLSQPSRR